MNEQEKYLQCLRKSFSTQELQIGSKTQTSKGNMQKVEAGRGNLGGIQRHCLSIWGRSYERQSLSGIESSRGYQRQQEGLLYVDR